MQYLLLLLIAECWHLHVATQLFILKVVLVRDTTTAGGGDDIAGDADSGDSIFLALTIAKFDILTSRGGFHAHDAPPEP